MSSSPGWVAGEKESVWVKYDVVELTGVAVKRKLDDVADPDVVGLP